MNKEIITRLFYSICIFYVVNCAKDVDTSDEIDKILDNADFDDMDSNKKQEGGEENDLAMDYEIEKIKAKEAGDIADLFGTNQHYNVPVNYQDLGRRFVPYYPYYEKENINNAAEAKFHEAIQQHLEAKRISGAKLKPVKAPPEFVLSIAKQSVLLEAAKPNNPSDDVIRKDMLRTRDYWDGVWKEEVDVNQMLRSKNRNENDLEPITVEISPGSKLYDLVAALKQQSPHLIYVINKRD